MTPTPKSSIRTRRSPAEAGLRTRRARSGLPGGRRRGRGTLCVGEISFLWLEPQVRIVWMSSLGGPGGARTPPGLASP